MSSPDWLSHGWLATLALTLGLGAVALLRHVCRRVFGAQLAVLLWVLPPLAVVVACLPHAAAASMTNLPPVVVEITSTPTPLVNAAQPTAQQRGLSWLMALTWLAGTMAVSLAAVAAQRRYRLRLRGASPMPGMTLSWPVPGLTVGGALSGKPWRRCSGSIPWRGGVCARCGMTWNWPAMPPCSGPTMRRARSMPAPCSRHRPPVRCCRWAAVGRHDIPSRRESSC